MALCWHSLLHLFSLLLATYPDFSFGDPCFLCSCGPFQNPEIRICHPPQNQSTAHSFHHSNCVTLSMTSRMNFRAFFLEVPLKGLTLSGWSWNWKEMVLKLAAILPPGRAKIEGKRESNPVLQTSSCPGASCACNLPTNAFFFTETSLRGVTSHLKLKNLTETTVSRYL